MANNFDTHVIFSPPNLHLVFTKKPPPQHHTSQQTKSPRYNEEKAA